MSSQNNTSYLFLGPELGKKQDAVKKIKENFCGAEESVFYAGETPASTIADTLQNMGLFSDKRIVIVKNAELVKKKDEVDLLASCIKNLENSCALILLSDETKVAAGLDAAVPASNKQIFYELFEKEKNEWVRNFFKRENINISADCIAAILELVENNTAALQQECSRLVHFIRSTDSDTVTLEDIEKWLTHNREESAFTLFSRIAAGDLAQSLESVSVMLAAKESAVSILAGLAWCFRKLADYHMLLETGEAGNFAELRKIGLIAPKAKDDYNKAARRFNAEAVETCLALTAEYDLLLRSPVSVMEDLLMTRYILSIFKLSE